MTAEVFESIKIDPGDEFEIQNTLSIEHVEYSDAPLVRVDTNYKSTRTSEYPVDLSLLDAVKASAALVRETLAAYDKDLEYNPKLAWDLLRELLLVDAGVIELRELLLTNVKPKEDEA